MGDTENGTWGSRELGGYVQREASQKKYYLFLTPEDREILVALLERAVDDIANYYGSPFARADFGAEYEEAEKKAYAERDWAEKLLKDWAK